VAEEVRGQGSAEAVRALGVDLLGPKGGGHNGMAGEGDGTFQAARERGNDVDLTVHGREASGSGFVEHRQQRVGLMHSGLPGNDRV
jgi:hypothetical protein